MTLSVLDPADVRRYARLGRKRVRVGWTRLSLSVRPSPRPLAPERAVEDLPESPRVLFLCLGNVCRSPMAERYLREAAARRGLGEFTAESAGFIEEENRPSPRAAVEAADDYGVDLGAHRSKLVTGPVLDRNDLVFLMDAYNYALLDGWFDEATEAAYFLGAFGADGYEITDPYRADVEEFRGAYGEIADAVDAFLDRTEADR